MIVEYRPSVEGLKNIYSKLLTWKTGKLKKWLNIQQTILNIFMGYERRILDRLDNWWWYSTCNISGYTKL